MLEPFSRCEIAFRDTLITKAEGYFLDKLGILYGFPRFALFERQYYRRALREVALGERGSYRTLFLALEHLFDQYYGRRGQYQVVLDPNHPHSVVSQSDLSFDCNSVSRFVRIDSMSFGSKIYFTQHVDNGRLFLNPITTPAMNGADWSSLARAEGATLKLIGFDIREIHPGPPSIDGVDEDGDPWHPLSFKEENTCTIDLLVDSNIWNVPATYLQQDGTIDRTVTAPGQPFGGHMMDLITAANLGEVDFPASGLANEPHPESGDQEEGPYPIYFDADGNVAKNFIDIIDGILAAGVHVRADVLDWCSRSNSILNVDPLGEFDIGLGAQPLPPSWNFGDYGIPRAAQNELTDNIIRLDGGNDDAYLVFSKIVNDQHAGYYFAKSAELDIDHEGNFILNTDSGYYRLCFAEMKTGLVTRTWNNGDYSPEIPSVAPLINYTDRHMGELKYHFPGSGSSTSFRYDKDVVGENGEASIGRMYLQPRDASYDNFFHPNLMSSTGRYQHSFRDDGTVCVAGTFNNLRSSIGIKLDPNIDVGSASPVANQHHTRHVVVLARFADEGQLADVAGLSLKEATVGSGDPKYHLPGEKAYDFNTNRYSGDPIGEIRPFMWQNKTEHEDYRGQGGELFVLEDDNGNRYYATKIEIRTEIEQSGDTKIIKYKDGYTGYSLVMLRPWEGSSDLRDNFRYSPPGPQYLENLENYTSEFMFHSRVHYVPAGEGPGYLANRTYADPPDQVPLYNFRDQAGRARIAAREPVFNFSEDHDRSLYKSQRFNSIENGNEVYPNIVAKMTVEVLDDSFPNSANAENEPRFNLGRAKHIAITGLQAMPIVQPTGSLYWRGEHGRPTVQGDGEGETEYFNLLDGDTNEGKIPLSCYTTGGLDASPSNRVDVLGNYEAMTLDTTGHGHSSLVGTSLTISTAWAYNFRESHTKYSYHQLLTVFFFNPKRLVKHSDRLPHVFRAPSNEEQPLVWRRPGKPLIGFTSHLPLSPLMPVEGHPEPAGVNPSSTAVVYMDRALTPAPNFDYYSGKRIKKYTDGHHQNLHIRPLSIRMPDPGIGPNRGRRDSMMSLKYEFDVIALLHPKTVANIFRLLRGLGFDQTFRLFLRRVKIDESILKENFGPFSNTGHQHCYIDTPAEDAHLRDGHFNILSLSPTDNGGATEPMTTLEHNKKYLGNRPETPNPKYRTFNI